ncbi:hypothetical protein GCM10023193_45520 [Planotetraspora kaengkrachanensis]|uniref:Secreted protein n=1 Tax=Planotetraspora kaengkrachanensis TaxID=575193 RepID=A0A8J3Q035_9ACTN|nr:hypothetical protein Pka01_73820 [Planotetraspora kaengkrachanensis]
MRNLTRMGAVAVAAAFLSIAAQSAASAQNEPPAKKPMKRAAQFFPNEDRNFAQRTKRDVTSLTVVAPNAGNRTVPTLRGVPFLPQSFPFPQNIGSQIQGNDAVPSFQFPQNIASQIQGGF